MKGTDIYVGTVSHAATEAEVQVSLAHSNTAWD